MSLINKSNVFTFAIFAVLVWRQFPVMLNNFQSQGYYSLDVMLHFIQYIKNYPNINEEIRINLINVLANKSYVMSKTSANYLQLTGAVLHCI